MEYQKEIHEYLQLHKEEITEIFKILLRMPSVQGQAEEQAPFGKECARVLEYVKGLYDENGFATELDAQGGYLLTYFGQGEKTLGLFAHADVVAAGDGWIYANPFNPIEKDGFIIGRGALDDKSAVVSSVYILKMFKELHIPLQSKLVCYTGGNEESGMQDIRNYLSKHTPPDFSLVPDTWFPLYRGNKGLLRCMVTSDVPMSVLNAFFGGDSTNITLGKATAKLGYNQTVYEEIKNKAMERITAAIENGEIVLQAEGISKHGALPEGTINAGGLLANLLIQCSFVNGSDKEQLCFLSEILQDIYGEKLGIACEDTEFGKLTCSNGVLQMKNAKLSFSLDIRFGKGTDVDELQKRLTETLTEKGFLIEFWNGRSAHVISENDEYVRSCLEVYKEFTGNENATTYINAGGTYAMCLPRAVEIGTVLYRHPSFTVPMGHGGAHQPDELISIDGMLDAIEIMALMLLACDKVEN